MVHSSMVKSWLSIQFGYLSIHPFSFVVLFPSDLGGRQPTSILLVLYVLKHMAYGRTHNLRVFISLIVTYMLVYSPHYVSRPIETLTRSIDLDRSLPNWSLQYCWGCSSVIKSEVNSRVPSRDASHRCIIALYTNLELSGSAFFVQ